jgi:hypothetical protein
VRKEDCVVICNFLCENSLLCVLHAFFVPKRRRKIKRSGFLGDKFGEDFHRRLKGFEFIGAFLQRAESGSNFTVS